MRVLSLMYGWITANLVDGDEMEPEPQVGCSKVV